MSETSAAPVSSQDSIDRHIIPTGTFFVAAVPGGKIRLSFGGIVHELSARKAISLSKALRAFGGMAVCESIEADKAKRLNKRSEAGTA